jgi:hypothetical protein
MINSDIINSIVAFTGLLTCIMTVLIIKESRLMRKYYSTPEISVFLKFAEASPDLMFLHIENLGMGTAYNVKFKLIEDFKYYQSNAVKLINKGVFREKLQHFYPKQQFKYLVGSVQGKKDDKFMDPIIIHVNYNDDSGNSYERIFNLNIDLYSGLGIISPGDTHIRVISYRLEKIQKDFNVLTSEIIKSIRDKRPDYDNN